MQSCGIEVYHYLSPISTGSITTSMNQEARIYLPSITSSDFTHFAMYYRIYLSYSNRTGFSLSANDLRDINQTLYYDYNYLSPYTDTTSATTVNVASVMANRGYQPLYFQVSGNYRNDVVNDNSGTATAELYFPPSGNPNPYLRYSGISGDLFLIRSNGGGAFYPLPASRRFLNTTELSNLANITQNANADVVAPSGTGSTRYAYVSIYITTAGINEQAGYVPIFSNPTLVGIFQIPAAASSP